MDEGGKELSPLVQQRFQRGGLALDLLAQVRVQTAIFADQQHFPAHHQRRKADHQHKAAEFLRPSAARGLEIAHCKRRHRAQQTVKSRGAEKIPAQKNARPKGPGREQDQINSGQQFPNGKQQTVGVDKKRRVW